MLFVSFHSSSVTLYEEKQSSFSSIKHLLIISIIIPFNINQIFEKCTIELVVIQNLFKDHGRITHKVIDIKSLCNFTKLIIRCALEKQALYQLLFSTLILFGYFQQYFAEEFKLFYVIQVLVDEQLLLLRTIWQRQRLIHTSIFYTDNVCTKIKINCSFIWKVEATDIFRGNSTLFLINIVEVHQIAFYVLLILFVRLLQLFIILRSINVYHMQIIIHYQPL